MSRFRPGKAFRDGWARILAEGEEYEKRRADAVRDGERSVIAGRASAVNRVAGIICDRWRAAGLPSARLVDGLPEPEPPHAADWIREDGSRIAVCGTCGRRSFRSPDPATCNGSPGDELVRDALARGIHFEPGEDGLPRASRAFPRHAPADDGRPVRDVVAKVNRAIVWRDRKDAEARHDFLGTSPTARRRAA